ncbi:ABC transporter permease [Sphingobacterium thalpophilum]|uniref:ABC transporter permease n=1 Tax=Sphingobacterium thalpophilum TaxID=259 RepID=UPI002D76981C|nr:ABC transporter permease [Sphingobacterium thalpophilum]
MIKNNLKIGFRTLNKNKGFSAINIIGLAIGLASVLLIALWVQNQFQYDNFYKNKDNIYKLMNKTDKNNSVNIHGITMPAAAPALESEFPEVEHAARMLWTEDQLLTYGEENLKAKGNSVDASFIDIFDFHIVKGAKSKALSEPNSIVLTEGFSKSIFGNDNPIGKTVIIKNERPYKVTAVMQDLPSYTDFDFKYLIPIDFERSKNLNSWNNNSLVTYVSLKPHTDVEAFNEKIKPLVTKNADFLKWSSVFLYPMSKVHLYSEFENGVVSGGKIDKVQLVAGIGLLILLIACINFMNLSTARSQKRSREVGVRKVIGAKKNTLIAQFLFESILLAFIAGVLAIFLTVLFLPIFNGLLDKPLQVEWTDPLIWTIGLSFILVTGFLAGIYPAFVLSSFKPIRILKGDSGRPKRFFNLRESLVVVQFAIAIFLIVATMVIRMQIKFGSERSVGYEASQLIEVPAEGDLEKNFESFKNELINQGFAESVTRTGGWTVAEGSGSAGGNFSWEGATADQVSNSFFGIVSTESDFVKTLGLKLTAGRDIDYARIKADSASVLINESAVKRMGIKNPVGKMIKWGNEPLTIVGVISDYILGSPYEEVQPLMVVARNKYLYNIVIRTKENTLMAETIAGIEKITKKFNPLYPFYYKFVDQQFAKKFQDEEQMGSLAFIFSLLAIFISCLGLFGLASYIAETRVKEIGIRKVLGASVAGICAMISKEFIKLVIIGLLLAAPVAWLAMNKWLEGFTYHIDVQWWMLGVAGGLAILIALITVSFQSIKAALVNPVDSLRDE